MIEGLIIEQFTLYICNMYYLPLISIYRHVPLIGDGMYHPLMLIWGMVYDFVYDIVFTLYLHWLMILFTTLCSHYIMYVCICIYIPHIYKLLYIYVYIYVYIHIYMEVSWNGSIPKSSILKRVFFHKQSIWGPHIYPLWYSIISVYYHMTPIIGRPMARSMTSSSMPVTWTGLSRFQWRTRPGDVLEKATIFGGFHGEFMRFHAGFYGFNNQKEHIPAEKIQLVIANWIQRTLEIHEISKSWSSH